MSDVEHLEKLYTEGLDELSRLRDFKAKLVQQLKETIDLAEAYGAPREELKEAWETVRKHDQDSRF